MTPRTLFKPQLHRALQRSALLATACAVLSAGVLLIGCTSKPRIPDWQLEAKSSLDRAVQAYLEGNARIQNAEMARMRRHIASTGQVELLATAELHACAAQVASLVFEPCTAFELLRADATPTQLAYARYLGGQGTAADQALLPAARREAPAAASSPAANVPKQTTTATAGAAQAKPVLPEVQEPDDALSTLATAGVALQTGQANPEVIEQALRTASQQGWRRPLLAWLMVQAQRAEQAGSTEEAARLRRRIALVQSNGAPPPNRLPTKP